MLLRRVILPLAFAASLLASRVGLGQVPSKNLGTFTATGPLPVVVSYAYIPAVPDNYTVDWSFNVAPPAACTLQVQGSSDAIHWAPLTDVLDCTVGNMISIAQTPVVYLQINVLTYTAGSSAGVTVRYTRGN